MSKWAMRGHFRYVRFETFPMTPRTPQCKVFWVLLSSSEHSGVPEDSNSSLFPSVGLHPPHLAKVGLRQLNIHSRCLVFFLLSLVGLGGGQKDFCLFSFVPASSQCVPHGCSQLHPALIPYVLLKVLPFSHI